MSRETCQYANQCPVPPGPTLLPAPGRPGQVVSSSSSLPFTGLGFDLVWLAGLAVVMIALGLLARWRACVTSGIRGYGTGTWTDGECVCTSHGPDADGGYDLVPPADGCPMHPGIVYVYLAEVDTVYRTKGADKVQFKLTNVAGKYKGNLLLNTQMLGRFSPGERFQIEISGESVRPLPTEEAP